MDYGDLKKVTIYSKYLKDYRWDIIIRSIELISEEGQYISYNYNNCFILTEKGDSLRDILSKLKYTSELESAIYRCTKIRFSFNKGGILEFEGIE